MSDTSNTVNEKTLNRFGLTQPDRQLAAMQDAFYVIEERSFSEWMAYMRNAAEKIRFYDSDVSSYADSQTAMQTWQGALPNEAESLALETLLAGGVVSSEISALAARPDIATLLTFFSLMAYPKKQFADFTDAHRHHYYQTVLGFTPNSVAPDSVNLVVTLNDDIAGMTLPAGTVFSGGSDINDQPLLYKTLGNAVINHAQVMKLSTLSGVSDYQRVFTQHIDMDNGLELSGDSIYTFGDDVLSDELAENQSNSHIGFTLASSALFLAGGERTVKIKLDCPEGTVLQLMSWFNISVSTIDGMVLLDAFSSPEEAPAWSLEENTIYNDEPYDLVLTFSDLFPSIVGLNSALELDASSLPHLHFMLKPEKEDEAIALKRTVFGGLRLDVDVVGLQGLFAENQNNSLDTSGPIEPFTLQPQIGSRFTFTHPELLVKPVSEANVSLEWLGRPDDLSEYYRAYNYYRYAQDNPGSTIEESDQAGWDKPNTTLGRSDSIAPLVEQTVFSSNLPINNLDRHNINFIDDADAAYPNGKVYDWDALPLTENKASLWPKFYTLTLADNDFGHADFSQVAQFIAYYNAQRIDEAGFIPLQVPVPYVPVLNEMSLSYSSSTEIEASALSSFKQPILQSILPIGRPRTPEGELVAILPLMADSAYLYLGLKNVTTPGQVRLYFQIDPVDGSNINNNYTVDWRYLSVDGFQSIPNSSLGTQAGRARITEDSTQQLLNSGVLAIEFPAIDDGLSGLDDGLLWLQLSIYNGDKDRVNYSRIKGVYTQGVTAELVIDNVDASHFVEPLPALSVAELEEADERVSEVMQPWPSFGASVEETDAQLAVRASERLRHKQRALTGWDYEHLVLNEFPEVYLARCYVSEDSDIDIELMLVPVNYDTSILQPKLPLYLHERIKTFVLSICPPEVTVKVRDPLYEEVTFDAALKIHSGYDIDSVVSRLNQKLIDHLTPWQNSADSEVIFNKSIHLTSLAGMLEEDDAVDVVHYLKATVLTETGILTTDSTTNIIEPSSNASILVPSQQQKITLVDQDVDVVSGIGKWRIELNFVVS